MVFTPRRGGKKFFSPPLLFSTTHSNRANSPTNTTNISLNDRCNRVAMYLSCYESEREFCRSEIESKFSRTANKVCESMRTERYIQRRREEERWREREGKVKVVKEKWKDEREGKKDIYIYIHIERERENVLELLSRSYRRNPSPAIMRDIPHLRLQLIRFSRVGACERSNELAC